MSVFELGIYEIQRCITVSNPVGPPTDDSTQPTSLRNERDMQECHELNEYIYQFSNTLRFVSWKGTCVEKAIRPNTYNRPHLTPGFAS